MLLNMAAAKSRKLVANSQDLAGELESIGLEKLDNLAEAIAAYCEDGAVDCAELVEELEFYGFDAGAVQNFLSLTGTVQEAHAILSDLMDYGIVTDGKTVWLLGNKEPKSGKNNPTQGRAIYTERQTESRAMYTERKSA